MQEIPQAYEIVIGLEVHIQLSTNTKLFCGDPASFGSEPNTHVSPITLAHPGTLPVMNKKAIEFAVKMGLACQCEIEIDNYFARKNYFYPDLPKGYQVSQHTTPICKGGRVNITVGGEEKNVQLNRIHLEEDAGKSLHDVEDANTCIDLNRAGVPLLEMVTEPDLRSSEEAFAFLTEIRKLVRYLGVCDGNMEEGSMRCDANISVRKKGDPQLGTRVEVKNLNSIRNVKKAIEFEAVRLVNQLERNETILQQTRSFDAGNGTTFSTREKEEANDYRYFPEPDLTPFHLTEDFIEEIRNTIPALPKERIRKYRVENQLSAYDASVLTEEKEFSDYYDALILHTDLYKPAANWMTGPVKTWMNETGNEIGAFPLSPASMAVLISLVEDGKLSFSIASGRLFQKLLDNPVKEPLVLAMEENLLQESNVNMLEPLVEDVLASHAEKVKAFQKGKKGLLGMFVGEVMKRSKGKADPKVVNDLLLEKLNNK
ncbi:MAG: Asp-tRNA(Asn)/Glu-tRNA(Gln) amidotransferase subunit GatB [Terrimonas sp.]|nr:Asp-tRNA(Asn)/Glu-tRNA(Gln) amidotransferase subunit GatB [Terrimonas sp.]